MTIKQTNPGLPSTAVWNPPAIGKPPQAKASAPSTQPSAAPKPAGNQNQVASATTANIRGAIGGPAINASSKVDNIQVPGGQTETEAVAWLSKNAQGGLVSRATVEKLPDGPAKEAILKHFDTLKFANPHVNGADQRREAWENLSVNDLKIIQNQLKKGDTIESFAKKVETRQLADFATKDTRKGMGPGPVPRGMEAQKPVQAAELSNAAPRVQSESEAITWLAKNAKNGLVSRDTIQKLPDGPAKEAILRNFEMLKFSDPHVKGADRRKEAWDNLSVNDLKIIQNQLKKGDTIDSFSAKVNLRVLQNQTNGTDTRRGL